MKRTIIATLSGFLFGLVCYTMASGSGELPFAVGVQIIASRTLIGFTIGISNIRLHWALHGTIIGLLYSVPLAFSGLMAPETPEFSASAIFISTLVMGAIYGLLIDLISTVLFKAKQKELAGK